MFICTYNLGLIHYTLCVLLEHTLLSCEILASLDTITRMLCYECFYNGLVSFSFYYKYDVSMATKCQKNNRAFQM